MCSLFLGFSRSTFHLSPRPCSVLRFRFDIGRRTNNPIFLLVATGDYLGYNSEANAVSFFQDSGIQFFPIIFHDRETKLFFGAGGKWVVFRVSQLLIKVPPKGLEFQEESSCLCTAEPLPRLRRATVNGSSLVNHIFSGLQTTPLIVVVEKFLLFCFSFSFVGLSEYDPKPKEADETPAAAKGKDDVQTFTFRELATATRNFRRDCSIGEGGFGRVYRGKLGKTGEVKIICKAS